MCIRRVLRIPLAAAALAILCETDASASFPVLSETVSKACVSGVCEWTWTLAAGAETGSTCGMFHWDMTPKSPAGAQPKTLTFDVQHEFRCHENDKENEPNPDPAATFTAGTFGAGDQKAGFFRIQHPKLARHEDHYVWSVVVPQSGDGTVKSRAKHTRKGLLPRYSYDPKGTTIRLTVIATYPSDADKTVVDDQKRSSEMRGKLPRSTNKKQEPSDVHIRVRHNPTTETTLAFVGGEPGSLELGDLATLTGFFQGENEYLAPKLFDDAGVQDLFVAVDLVQWLSFGTAFNDGDTYTITAGENASLPGYLVSTSAITFDPSAGFTTTSPFTGDVRVIGEIGGRVVPDVVPALSAPLAIVLSLSIAMVGAASAIWHRRARATSG